MHGRNNSKGKQLERRVFRMAESDSGDRAGVCGSQQIADSGRERSSAEGTRAQDEGVPEPSEL